MTLTYKARRRGGISGKGLEMKSSKSLMNLDMGNEAAFRMLVRESGNEVEKSQGAFKVTLMEKDSPHDFELPVFTEPQKDPEPMGYENAVRAFEEIMTEHRLHERPRAVDVLPEFRMD